MVQRYLSQGCLKLRKYYPLQLYVFENLEEQKFQFINPVEFNDPFDCLLLKDQNFLNTIDENLKEWIREYKVLCLFKYDDNIDYKKQQYFWSFYGQSHKGICVEIEIPEKNFISGSNFYDLDCTEQSFSTEKNYLICKQVDYYPNIINNLESIKLTTNRISELELIKKIFFSKDDIYKIEGEYRIISRYINFCTKNFKKKIIFGNKCSNSYRSLIYNAMRDKYSEFLFISDNMEELIYEN